jgi:hypothetical protein
MTWAIVTLTLQSKIRLKSNFLKYFQKDKIDCGTYDCWTYEKPLNPCVLYKFDENKCTKCTTENCLKNQTITVDELILCPIYECTGPRPKAEITPTEYVFIGVGAGGGFMVGLQLIYFIALKIKRKYQVITVPIPL